MKSTLNDVLTVWISLFRQFRTIQSLTANFYTYLVIWMDYNNIEQFHSFSVELNTKGNNTFRIFLNSDEEIGIEISGIYAYLCDKSEYNDYIIFKNGKCIIDDVECDIVDVKCETISQFNDWCERLEMEEMEDYYDG